MSPGLEISGFPKRPPATNRRVIEEFLESAPEGDPRRPEVERAFAGLRRLAEEDPLQHLWPHVCRHCRAYHGVPCGPEHRTPQLDWFGFTAKKQAAFAGNRFGKTTGLIGKVLIQHRKPELLPEHLRAFRLTQTERPVMGRLLVPSEKALVEYTIPKFKELTPKAMFRGGSWDKAYDKQHNILNFADDQGQIGIYTYKQDPATMVGAELDYGAYDEPPPEGHRNETLARLVDRDGFEMFALTPVNMTGGGIGWLYRKVWKKRDTPGTDVVKASIWDNPHLKPEAIERILSEFPAEERQAREHGDFLHFGGMVYVGGFEQHLCDPPARGHVKELDVVVGIDPGLRNAAFVFVGFDSDNVGCVFDEVLLQDRTPKDYAQAIKRTLAKWGVNRPLFVIDPSARNRSLVNAESVEAALQREGIHCVHGQNAVEAGVQEVRKRLQQGALVVSRDCKGLRDEAEEYRIEDRPDGEFKVVKENDHRLDALRYACMSRAWHGGKNYGTAEPPEVWVPGEASPHLFDRLGQNHEVPPMGAMS